MERRIESIIMEDQLASALGVSKRTIQGWRYDGCPYLKLGTARGFFEDELLDWLAKHRRHVAGVSGAREDAEEA